MESISSEKLQIIWHTLSKIELAISRLQERTAAIKTVDAEVAGIRSYIISTLITRYKLMLL